MPLIVIVALLSVSRDSFASCSRFVLPRGVLQAVNPRWEPIFRYGSVLNPSRCPNEHDDQGNCLCQRGQRCQTEGLWGNGASPLEVANANSCPVAGTRAGPPDRSSDRYHVNCQSCSCIDMPPDESEAERMEANSGERNISATAGLALVAELTPEAAEMAIDALLPEVDGASDSQKRLGESMREHLRQEILCPISHAPMRDPVVIADGNTYERSAIQQWFQTRREGSLPLTSPLNGNSLPNDSIVSNLAVRKTIQLLLEFAPTAPV